MKKKIIIGALIFTGTILGAQSSATFTQSIPLKSVLPLVIALEQPCNIKTCKGDAVMVETTVSLQNGGDETLQYLNHQDEYKLYLKKDMDGLKITDNTRRRLAMINGVPLCETISYVIRIPEGYTVETAPSATLIARQ